MPRALVLLLCLIPAACTKTTISLGGLSCDDAGECLDGYSCHPESHTCVADLAFGCTDPTMLCPSQVETGEPCPSEGSWIPCADDVDDCSQGCRTCTGGVWSECTDGECTLGLPESCTTCTDDCTATVQNATVICDTSETPAVCGYSACTGTYADADSIATNGCECLPTGTDIPCNTLDEDCDGADDTESGTVANCASCGDDCSTTILNATPTCDTSGTANVCDYTSCAGNFRDADNNRANGCECERSNGGNETCDGIDNDCNGTVDDVGNIDNDCDAKFGPPDPPDVDAWACDSASCTAADNCCVIAACNAGTSDLDHNPATGCEGPCVETVPDTEICDGLDNDCDGETDNGDEDATGCSPFLLDADDDTFGVTGDTECWCRPTGDYTATVGGDCLDSEPTVNPSGTEVTADGVDQDCNGQDRCFVDADGDSFGTTATADETDGDIDCSTGAGVSPSNTDCNDNAATGGAIYPGADEIVADSTDQNCDNFDDCYQDLDDDGFGTAVVVTDDDLNCANPSQPTATVNTDCQDTGTGAAGIYPGATEVTADNRDQDCNGEDQCFIDADGDGFGSTLTTDDADGDLDCTTGTGISDVDTDCLDIGAGAANINPNTPEIPTDDIDQNCDGEDLCYADTDGDGYGSTSTTNDVDGDLDCATGAGVSANQDDCDDTGPCGADCNPGETESPASNCTDTYDNDCANGADCADTACATEPICACDDLDGDGHGDQACGGTDCDDTLPTCTTNCTANEDGDSEANCVEIYCGSAPGDAASFCTRVSTETELDEAITAAVDTSAHDYILVDSLTLSSAPPDLDDSGGTTVRGAVGAVITVNTGMNPVFDLTSDGNVLIDLTIDVDAGGDVSVIDIDGSDNRIIRVTMIGTSNLLEGIEVNNDNAAITECRIWGFEERGIYVDGGDQTRIRNNVIAHGTTEAGNERAGVVLRDTTGILMVSNVIHDVASACVQARNTTVSFLDHNTLNACHYGLQFRHTQPATICARNNIISNNTVGFASEWDNADAWDLSDACTGPLAGAFDYGNDDFNNTTSCGEDCTNCASCLPAGNFFEFSVDPGYVTQTATEPAFMCISEATLIDAGDNLGRDVNGRAAGNFNSTAPDIGGRESSAEGCP